MKKILILFSIIIFLVSCSSKRKLTSMVTGYKLDNGLSLFVAEDHSVPLAYIEIAVRCGSLTQVKENCGIFHLYEHMMFKGNSLYKDAASVQNALSKLGVASWNGTTGVQCVNYYFTVPSYELESGLKFWNAAIREPLMDVTEFEKEKNVVISEINGNVNDTGRITGSFINNKFFSEAPWKLDPSGTEKTVRNATLSMLKEIKDRYYVPDNSALFVGGDVEPGKVFKLVNEIYGSWKKGNGNYDEEVPVFTKEPFSAPEYYVIPNDKVSTQIAQVNVYYRGADSDFEKEDTYALDLLTDYFSDPESSYVKTMLAHPELKIPQYNYTGFGYSTQRRMGRISFAEVMTEPDYNLPERTKRVLEIINEEIISENLNSKEIVPESNRKLIKRQSKDSKIYEEETAEGALSSLRFWWCDCGVDYYLNYAKKKNAVKNSDLVRVIKKYLEGKQPLVVLMVNPEVYEKQKQQFVEADFKEINAQNAFWWSEENE